MTFCVLPKWPVGVVVAALLGDTFTATLGGVVAAGLGVFIMRELPDALGEKDGLDWVTGEVVGSSYFCNCSR